ncbi:MAG: hypothetical protein KDH88_19460 [Chromatiales bacterium]|nr:hypothetical protein [Chromatiales bacterium]
MSDRDDKLSEEMLNALVDGDFPPEEQAEMWARLRADDELTDRACEIRTLKDLVSIAHQDVPAPPEFAQVKRRGAAGSLAVAAAVLLFVVGAILGWQLREVPVGAGDRFVVLDPSGRGQAPLQQEHSDETRIVFHITSPDDVRAEELLDEIEGMLVQFQKEGRALRIEVVAHNEGLNLLRSHLSKHKRHIADLAARFPNLTFVACQNTINRIQVEQGVEVTLIPEAIRTESGVAHVVKRQAEGWAYIQG